MASTSSERETARAAAWPLYWFAVLEQALDVGDLEAAAKAQRELRRLGVKVTYRRLERKGDVHAP